MKEKEADRARLSAVRQKCQELTAIFVAILKRSKEPKTIS
jgi:hypothetical protein